METLKETNRNCLNQLCQGSGKQPVYSHQANTQSRKSHIQSGQEVLWCSYLLLPDSFPGVVAGLKLQQPSSQVPPLNWRERADFIGKLLFVYSKLCVGYLKDKVPICFA